MTCPLCGYENIEEHDKHECPNLIQYCPACREQVKFLYEKPSDTLPTVGGTSTVPDFIQDPTSSAVTNINWQFTTNAIPLTTHRVFKCCNPECWVTKIEVDWGRS